MYSSSSMDRGILSTLPTVLRHKLQSQMAHFAALDNAHVYKNLYEINTAFDEALIFCINIFLTKGFDVIKKDANSECSRRRVTPFTSC